MDLTGYTHLYGLPVLLAQYPPVHSPDERCDEEDCLYCAALECRGHDPLHRHHDGCPAGCGEIVPNVSCGYCNSTVFIFGSTYAAGSVFCTTACYEEVWAEYRWYAFSPCEVHGFNDYDQLTPELLGQVLAGPFSQYSDAYNASKYYWLCDGCGEWKNAATHLTEVGHYFCDEACRERYSVEHQPALESEPVELDWKAGFDGLPPALPDTPLGEPPYIGDPEDFPF